VTDHSMLFSAPMVRALLSGRKTQTRRILRNPEYYGCPTGDCPHDKQAECNAAMRENALPDVRLAVGDRIWVREAWRTSKVADELKPSQLCGGDYTPVWYECDRDNCDAHGRCRGARQMPKWASRLTLIVTNVRLEQLQDICEADAIAEGWPAGLVFPIDWYRELWDSINGAGAWSSNPWVTAFSFDVIRANINVA
jgi:hypothetical protein